MSKDLQVGVASRPVNHLAIIMDVFTRSIRGWHLGRSLGQELTLIALQRALAAHTPVIHHSDQGIQYAAPQYVQLLRAAGVRISMAAVGEPRQNGYAERVIRTIKEEEIDLEDVFIDIMNRQPGAGVPA